MELAQIEKNMREAVNQIEVIGSQYAQARGTSYHLQELRKVILAREMKRFDGSVANKEMEARASERYEQHLEGTRDAIIEETRLRATFEKWKAQYDACRSLLSAEKAKMNM